jgi:glycerol-3-phosphate dehydrogenase
MSMQSEPSLTPEPSYDARCDVLVVGGGLQGAATARDLAGRGWSVILCEQGDLGQRSAAPAPQWMGGSLQDLAHGQLHSLRLALTERETLIDAAPHLVRLQPSLLVHDPALRPLWRMRMGMWMLDHLVPRQLLPDIQAVDLGQDAPGWGLQPSWAEGFVLPAAVGHEARLAVACAQDARDHGGHVLTRARAEQFMASEAGWQVLLAHRAPLEGRLTHHTRVLARCVVNAAGGEHEAVQHRLQEALGQAPATSAARSGWVRQVHALVPAIGQAGRALVLQGLQGQWLEVLPAGEHALLIFRQPVPWPEPSSADSTEADKAARVSADVQALLLMANRYFQRSLAPSDVRWHRVVHHPVLAAPRRVAGRVRRVPGVDHAEGACPWVAVRGVPFTLWRLAAEEAGSLVGEALSDHRDPWTRHATLPGGRLADHIPVEVDPASDQDTFVQQLRHKHPWLDLGLARRWVQQFGSAVVVMLEGIGSRADLGDEVLPSLHEHELQHLVRHEWARTADDVLWRRTSLGVHCTPEQVQHLQAWMARAQG